MIEFVPGISRPGNSREIGALNSSHFPGIRSGNPGKVNLACIDDFPVTSQPDVNTPCVSVGGKKTPRWLKPIHFIPFFLLFPSHTDGSIGFDKTCPMLNHDSHKYANL